MGKPGSSLLHLDPEVNPVDLVRGIQCDAFGKILQTAEDRDRRWVYTPSVCHSDSSLAGPSLFLPPRISRACAGAAYRPFFGIELYKP